MINNYDLVLGILMEHTRDNSKEAEAFREQLTNRSSEYVEEILAPHFGGMIQFIKECEQMVEKEQVTLASIVVDFWWCSDTNAYLFYRLKSYVVKSADHSQ